MLLGNLIQLQCQTMCRLCELLLSGQAAAVVVVVTELLEQGVNPAAVVVVVDMLKDILM
jgi:hypothetical protein